MNAGSGHPAPQRIAVVLGTRPEIIKLAPVIHELGEIAEPVFTGQHYDPQLTDVFFGEGGLARPPVIVPGVGGAPRAEQVGRMLIGLTEAFRADPPAGVIVQGDTNSANAAAQAAHYLGIPLLHVEAGLRSFDPAMPEEINRMVIGAMADVHCCATEGNAANLLRAGIRPERVHVTGNPIVEATLAARPSPRTVATLLAALELQPGGFVLATFHRPENTDDRERLAEILRQLQALAMPVLLPLHPRTTAQLERFGLTLPPDVRPLPGVDHRTFLGLASAAALIVSDSGGVQEETTVLRQPLVVVRNSTERQETIDAGFARLTTPGGIVAAAHELTGPGRPDLANLPCPFGDGRASERIARLARQLLAERAGRAAAVSSGCPAA